MLANTIDDEKDRRGRAVEQAALSRAGRISERDLENIGEESETLGKGENRSHF